MGMIKDFSRSGRSGRECQTFTDQHSAVFFQNALLRSRAPWQLFRTTPQPWSRLATLGASESALRLRVDTARSYRLSRRG